MDATYVATGWLNEKGEREMALRYFCSACNGMFETSRGRNRHVRMMHKRPYGCTMCSQRFEFAFELVHHRCTPASNRVRCPVEGCRRSYTLATSLAAHRSSHYRCSRCSKEFVREFARDEHQNGWFSCDGHWKKKVSRVNGGGFELMV